MNMAIYQESDIFFNINMMMINKPRVINLLMRTIMLNCLRAIVQIVTVVSQLNNQSQSLDQFLLSTIFQWSSYCSRDVLHPLYTC